MHGLGVMLYKADLKNNGKNKVYEGFWYKGKKHGQGYESFPNGDLYIGAYEAGRPSGNGVKTWAQSNEQYEGEWLQGNRHGIGSWTMLEQSYTGHFKNNHFEGFGIWKKDEESYEGEWMMS